MKIKDYNKLMGVMFENIENTTYNAAVSTNKMLDSLELLSYEQIA